MKLPRGHTPRVTADGKVEVHRHDEEKLARGGFGERMLRSLGWRDGDGLGVDRQGRAEAVRVTQKLDNKGVGANKAPAAATDWGDAWWERAFDQGAKKHKAGGSGARSSSGSDSSSSSSSDSDDSSSSSDASTSSSSSSSSDSSDSSDSDRKSTKKKKKGNKKASAATRHRDGTLTSATAAEMAIARALAADPWGRFGGREGKMARIARMEREAAARAGAALNATLGEKGGKEQEEEGKEEEEDKSAAPSKQKQREKTKRKKESSKAAASEATEKTVAVPPPPLAAAPEAPATPLYTPPAGWWGNSFFVHAGRLEGIISDSREKKERGGKEASRGFTDADQEALAERSTALKAAGKRGLGAASSKKKEKAVGHEWKGSKVVFGDGEGEDDCEDGGGADNKRERKKQKKEKKEKKEKKSKEAPPSPPLDVSSLKWKKAAEAALSQGGSGGAKKAMKKGLSVSELAAQVAAALSAKASASKGDLEAALGRSLRSLCESSSRFEVDGKGRVKLAAAKKK